jgi:triosephosphate isomerase
MRKAIVAGNWKMHGSKLFVANLLSALNAAIKKEQDVKVLIFPPFVYLDQASKLLEKSPILLGAQNCYGKLEGAYTGEISPRMLKDFRCDYVLLGHSERRHLFGETNEDIAAKFLAVKGLGLCPILCVGETKEQHEANQTFEIICNQLAFILEQDDAKDKIENMIIAYEPVWAIGTGLTATPDQAQAVHEFIRQALRKIDKLLAEKLRILYGGSVKLDNAADLFKMPDIDGFLVGGASLNAKEFLEIVNICS